MKMLLYYVIPAVLVVFFIFLMTSAPYLKHPTSKTDDVSMYLEKMKKEVKEEQWVQASLDQDRLEKAWQEVLPRVQVASGKLEIDHINTTISRLYGFIEAHGKPGALAELSELTMYWKHLGSG